MLQGLLRDHPKNPEHYKSLAGIFAQMGKTDQVSTEIIATTTEEGTTEAKADLLTYHPNTNPFDSSTHVPPS